MPTARSCYLRERAARSRERRRRGAALRCGAAAMLDAAPPPAARLADLAVVLFGVSVIVFLMIRLIPGDAVAIMLGANTEVTPERMAELRARIGLDQPARRAVPALGRRGAARRSRHLAVDRPAGGRRDPRPSLADARADLSWRSSLGAGLAVPVGCLMAQTRGGGADVGAARRRHRRPHDPVLLARHRADPRSCRSSRPASPRSATCRSRGPARQPAAHGRCRRSRSALPILANLSRLVRSAMLDALGQDYIRTARAKGAQRDARRLQARAAQRADPVRHQRRHHGRLPARRRHRGRAGLRASPGSAA